MPTLPTENIASGCRTYCSTCDTATAVHIPYVSIRILVTNLTPTLYAAQLLTTPCERLDRISYTPSGQTHNDNNRSLTDVLIRDTWYAIPVFVSWIANLEYR